METLEFLTEVWFNYATGEGTIEDVITEYEKHSLDTNQDSPGNLHWEALYKASPPGTKVILTVRDSDEQWYNSWKNYLERGRLLCLTRQYRRCKTSEHKKMSIFGLSNAKLRSVLAKYGYLGEECQRTYEIHSMTELNPFQGKKIRN